MDNQQRFERLASGLAGGTKIASRKLANPHLSIEKAMDENRFLEGLKHLFGTPDQLGDTLFSYSIRELETGIEFEVYSAQSGPAYGGTLQHYDDLKTGKLKMEVLYVLLLFDTMIENVSDGT